MNKQEIKLDLIQWIQQLDDERVILQLQSIKDGGDWWNQISEVEKKAIDEGISQLASGDTVDHKTVVKKAREKLNG